MTKHDDYNFGIPAISARKILVGTTLCLSLILNAYQFHGYVKAKKQHAEAIQECLGEQKALLSAYRQK